MFCPKESYCQIAGCKISHRKHFTFQHPRGDKPVKMESPAASEAQPSNAQNDRPNDEALRCFMEVVICESLCSATAASMNVCKISPNTRLYLILSGTKRILMALKAKSRNLQVSSGPRKRNSWVDCPLAFANSYTQIHVQQLNNCGLIFATCMIRSLILTSPTLLLMTYLLMQRLGLNTYMYMERV